MGCTLIIFLRQASFTPQAPATLYKFFLTVISAFEDLTHLFGLTCKHYRANHKEWEQALELLVQMERKEVQLDIISFDAAISACGKAGEWEQALVLFDLSAQKAQPNIITCSTVISACGNAGEWPRALHFFDEALGD